MVGPRNVEQELCKLPRVSTVASEMPSDITCVSFWPRAGHTPELQTSVRGLPKQRTWRSPRQRSSGSAVGTHGAAGAAEHPNGGAERLVKMQGKDPGM